MITAPARQTVLSTDVLRRIVPSVFATSAHEGMSSRYRFVPTIEVVDILKDRGFLPVRAEQSRARLEGKRDFTRHMLRFRHEGYLNGGPLVLGQEIPELVLTNSHDGSSAYQFSAGLFRLVCLNGLVVPTGSTGSVSVKHVGGPDFSERVIDATFTVVEQSGLAVERAAEFKQIALSPPQAKVFAEAAAELVETPNLRPDSLLQTRRREDREGNLWTTFNTVQENVLKGGIRTTAPDGRRSTTRPVKAVDRDVKLNKALWTLAEKMAELVG